MDSATPLQIHLISLYNDYNKLLLFGHSQELLEDEAFKKKLNELRKLHCGVCNVTFHSSEARENHFKDKHQNEGKNWICDQCNKSFAKKKYLSTHLKLHSKVLRCDLCNFKCNIRSVFNEHCKTCRIDCTYCYNKFRSEHALTNHIEFVHKKVKCDVCNQSFVSKRNLLRHKISKHKDTNVGILYTCKVRILYLSNKFFNKIYLLKFDFINNCIITCYFFIYECYYYLQSCDAVFNSMSALNTHSNNGTCIPNQDYKDIYSEYKYFNQDNKMDLDIGATETVGNDDAENSEKEMKRNEEEDISEEEEISNEEESHSSNEHQISDHTYASTIPPLNLDGTIKSKLKYHIYFIQIEI